MSISMYQSNIARLTKDISILEKQAGDETQKIARLQSDVHSIQRSITRSTSASLLRMKSQQITSKQNDIGRSQKKLADIRSKLSSKLADLHRNQQSLARLQDQERKRTEADDKKRKDEELKHTRQITSELEKQRQLSSSIQRSQRLPQHRLIITSPEITDPVIVSGEEEIEHLFPEEANHQPRVQRRRGGPIPTPKAKKRAIIAGWQEAQDRMTQEAYCRQKGINPSTLRKWIRAEER